jgi:hypothetical protein
MIVGEDSDMGVWVRAEGENGEIGDAWIPDEFESALRRLPDGNFLNCTLSIAKALRIGDELTPDARLIVQAEMLEDLVRRARAREESS